jgi:hypothetical protein
MWTIPAATAVEAGQDLAKGQASLAAAERAAHPTILVRDIARHIGAETSRFETGAYSPAGEGNGKPFVIVPDVHLPLEAASGMPSAVWPDDRLRLLPTCAFDARAPPVQAA